MLSTSTARDGLRLVLAATSLHRAALAIDPLDFMLMSSDADSELPRKLGPYRIERLAGRGGMGEVYRAFDQRLQRRVALKRVLAEGEVNADIRQRFLREARAEARLSHPNIAQIYDIIEDGDELWIVMEWIEGRSLRSLLDDGPMPLEKALGLAEEIARGLTAAHAEGVVHRDLKSENVMIDDSGSAKILDFGLAKLEPLEDGDADTLTKLGMVIGTPRAMSPEQALGQAVDYRADFFSFGVLLYEVVTGVSPFRASSAQVTLRKLCIEDPTPVRVRAPDVPFHLETLISDLLQKEPTHRPDSGAEILQRLANPAQPHPSSGSGSRTSEQAPVLMSTLIDGKVPSRADSTGFTIKASPSRGFASTDRAGSPQPTRQRLGWIVAAILLVLLAAASTWHQVQGPPARRQSVAVLRPELAIGIAGDQTDLLAFTLHSALLRTLTSFESSSPKSPAEVDAVSGPPTAIAQATGADEVLTTTLVCKNLDCQAELSRIRGEDGELLKRSRVQVPIDSLLTAAKAIGAGLFRIYPEEPVNPDQASLRVTPEDFAAYIDIRRTFEARPEISALPTLLDRLEGLRGSSPRFVDLYLLEAEVANYGFFETREQEFLDRALGLIKQAQELAPDSLEVLDRRFWLEVHTGSFEQAEQTLDTLEVLVPGDLWNVDRRASLLERQGNTEEALALYRSAIARSPSWQTFYRHAELAQKAGEIVAAKASLESLLALSPGNTRGLSLLAYLELKSGDPRRAAELYAALIAEAPSLTRLTNLGIAHMLAGDYGPSASAFEKAVAQAPKHSLYLLNLADARALEGRLEEAAELYRKVLVLIDEDPTGDYKQLSRRAQALAQLGRHHESVEALQLALRSAPDEDLVAFQAALIYTLTGDHTAAIVNVKAALDLGFDPRWFGLPWFDALRSRSDFTQLLAGDGYRSHQPPPLEPGGGSEAGSGYGRPG